jgi:hypothetical protein
MTIGEMKTFLANHPELDDSVEMEIAICVKTDRYPKAYVSANFSYPVAIIGDGEHKRVRIDAHCPEGMTVSQRKVK